MNQAGLKRVLASSLGCIEEGALGMSGWLLIGLSAVSIGSAAAPVQQPPTAPVRLAQADLTTPTYAVPAMDP